MRTKISYHQCVLCPVTAPKNRHLQTVRAATSLSLFKSHVTLTFSQRNPESKKEGDFRSRRLGLGNLRCLHEISQPQGKERWVKDGRTFSTASPAVAGS